MGTTRIEWCDKVWNPITGCSHSGSPGCDNCWAKRMAYRLKGRYGYSTDDPFRVTFHPDRLDEPLHWKKPCRIFVCSMGDLFHEYVHFDWQLQVWLMVRDNPKHTFLFLTKRPKEMKDFFEFLYRHPVWKAGLKEPLSNLMLGVSVEDQKTADERIPILLQIPATKRFVSVEPMLGPVNLDDYFYHGKGHYEDTPGGQRYHIWDQTINWVICGGETGPRTRPLHTDWVRSLRDQCQAAGMPFFFKSWGRQKCNCYLNLKQADRINHGRTGISYECPIHDWGQEVGRLLDGKIWEETPCSKDFS